MDREAAGFGSFVERYAGAYSGVQLALPNPVPRRTKVNAMADHEVEPAASTGKTRLGKIAAYVAGAIICVLALLVVAEWNMKPENPVARIRDECQKNHGNLGPTRVSECLSELVMRRYGRESP